MADNSRLTRITGLPRPATFKSLEDAQRAQEELYRALSEWRVDIPRPNQLTNDLYVRPEWYGAVGDGTTDDTVAIQAAADALTSGQMLVFTPGKTYATGTIWIKTSNVWVGCIGGRATLKFDDADFHYGIMVHGGTITAANRTLAYYNATYGLTDYNGSRISNVVVENIDLTSASGAVESCFDFEWADDCALINCSSAGSAGNGINLRFCRRPLVRDCSVSGPAAYNVFCWMSRDALIENNSFSGGTKGIELKHRYDNEPCNHRVINNVFTDTYNPIGGGLGLLDTETASYYITGYDVVEGCLIYGNKFISTSAVSAAAPIVTVGVCAEQWKLINNEFDGDGLSGAYAIQLGSSGSWTPGVKVGTPGQNHLVAGNSFANMILTRVLDIGASSEIVDNQVSCQCRMFAYESTTRINDALDIWLKGNVIRTALLAVSGQGLLATVAANTKTLTLIDNIVDITPLVNSTNAYLTVVYSLAVLNIVSGNYIRVQKGPATHTNMTGLLMGGATNYITGNYIALDSQTTTYGIYIGATSTALQSIVHDNILEDLGTSTSTGIYGGVQIDSRFNKFIGGWTTTENHTGTETSLYRDANTITIKNNESAEKTLLTLEQLGSWGAQKYQNINWKNSVDVVAALGPHYVSGSDTVDLVFHSFYNTDYKTSSTINAILSGKGNFALGADAAPFGSSATNTVSVRSGTAPGSSPADHFQLYSADFAAGNACPTFRTENGTVIVLNQDLKTTATPTFAGASFTDQPRTATSLYRRYYHIPLGSSNPGASGATWVDADANTTGGWQLNAAGEKIRGGTDVHADWDGASDMKVEVRFNVNVDNTGGAAGDTVDLKLVCYYKGVGDTATKTQTVEVPTTVGASARYKAFKADFTIDYDAASNVVEAGDHISFYLNLETDTSEVDDVIITGMSFSYLTTHMGIEDGDE